MLKPSATFGPISLTAGMLLVGALPVQAQHVAVPAVRDAVDSLAGVPGFLWAGPDSLLTLDRLVAYGAPILWFSPDEPNLKGASGRDIRVPEAFPFETAPDAPVAYFMVRRLYAQEDRPGWVYQPDAIHRGHATVNLSRLDGVDLDYFFYYATEEGLGGHQHDVESVQMKLVVLRQPECRGCEFALIALKATGKAHGMQWYDNTLVVDEGSRFPMRILVEEGKHASCTDKNGDGYYTPGFDVNRNINDAWGVRDVIRSGALFSGGWQSWMAKVRQEPDQVLPPLPEDSPLRGTLTVAGTYAPDHAVYQLRPFPSDSLADAELKPFINDKGSAAWPEVKEYASTGNYENWLEDRAFATSLSIAYRYDGRSGVAAVFPLFVVKNMNIGLTGGWLMNRVYVQQDRWAWMLLYTSSASNWIGSYVSGGAQWTRTSDSVTGSATTADFVGELGMKFRVNMVHTPAKFLARITDFWGVRVGLKATGGFDIDQLAYVIEVGAGTF